MRRAGNDDGGMTMDDATWLAERFEEHRAHLTSVAYRMLGSLPEADDAVQEAWLRVARAGADGVENLGGWLTTIVARMCLNQLRRRAARPEVSLDVHVPDPVVVPLQDHHPEEVAVLAESVSLALLVVLDTLAPDERLAFVLHDMFDVPFDQIAQMTERSVTAARQLASRARRRVRGAEPAPTAPDLARQREVVDAFVRAARGGDFDALVAVLHPEVLLRADAGRPGLSAVIRGAAAVAGQALRFATPTQVHTPALVNGGVGLVVTDRGRPVSVLGFTIAAGKIMEIDLVADPERVRRAAAEVLGDS